MADTLARLDFRTLTTTNATCYTGPTAGAVIRNIHLANITSTDTTVSIALNGTAATNTNCLYYLVPLPANSVHVLSTNIVLASTETIQALCGAANAVKIMLNGVTF